MTWYYESEGVQVGPLTEDEFENLVRIGKIRPETLVWNESLSGWKPLSEVVPPAVRPSPSGPPNVVICSECGNLYPPQDLIQIQGRSVCARCKPIVVQRLKEGVLPVAGAEDANRLIEEVQRRDYSVNIGDNLRSAWERVKGNFWPAVAVTLIITVIQQGPGIIPFIGPFISLAIMGPLYGGLYYFFLKMVRGEPTEINDGFKGFGPRWGQLVGGQLIPVLIVYLFFIPAVIAALAFGQFSQDAPGIAFIVLMLAALPFVFYYSVCWFFTVPLIMDKGLGFWDAMKVSKSAVSMHFGSVFLYILVMGLVNILGLLACCIGIFVSLPVFFTAVMQLYEEIFTGPKAANSYLAK